MKKEEGKKQMAKGMEEISRDRRKWEDGRKWKKMGGYGLGRDVGENGRMERWGGRPPAVRAVATTGNTLGINRRLCRDGTEWNGIGSRAITSAWEILWGYFERRQYGNCDLTSNLQKGHQQAILTNINSTTTKNIL